MIDPAHVQSIRDELRQHLEHELIPFWRRRAWDPRHGGFLTNFGPAGEDLGTPEKYLNTQARMVWGFSRFYSLLGREEDADLARRGMRWMIEKFWDKRHGGWFWKVNRDGSLLDDGKVVYGQSFAIYALAQCHLATRDETALKYACHTFDLLQKYAADTRHGGYCENLERDWTLAPSGFCGGDRKGLDTHMHLMESFTTLLSAGGQKIHRRKLLEIVDLIAARMIDSASGCGGNQYDLSLSPLPAIAIRRTWNAERQGEAPAEPTRTTSYGHNVELAWLMHLALRTAGADVSPYLPCLRRLLDHAMAYGIDREFGGVYRDGAPDGGLLILEKEFWQHAEVLVGFLDGYLLFGEEKYFEAFENVWRFVTKHMIDHGAGEWRTLLDRRGNILDGNLGNPWKVCYHSGRSMIECLQRLERMDA